jgi:sugar/nucleoside kinase (ribokinase family)
MQKVCSNKFLLKGVNVVAISLCENGCFVTDGDQEYNIEARPEKIKDRIGAEDAFIAGFIYAYLKNYDLYECGETGNKMAIQCMKEEGARKGLPKNII